MDPRAPPTIRVHVRVLGVLTRPGGRSELDVDLRAGSRVEDLLLALGYHRAHARLILAAVGGVQRRQTDALTHGDEVTLLLPASGG